MKPRSIYHWLSALALAVAAVGAHANAPQACPALLNHSFTPLLDDKPQSLCQYAGKVILVVNTASECGFTPQYEGLQKLHTRWKDKGLVVLGFPSNDFGGQEPGSSKEIADFCKVNYGVDFPMMSKTVVRGSGANAFYQQLAQRSGSTPKWNFHKYLISRDGSQVVAYTSLTKPDDRDLARQIEAFVGR